jgi:hypothetical protein
MHAMESSDVLVSLGVGLGLSAACGFRVFIPLLALSVAARMGLVPVAPDFAWIASTQALVALGAAAFLEVLAYFVPWLDHALDVIATPGAMVAGVVATAAVFADVPPLVRWGAALAAGGGTAGLVQSATVLARIKSAALTGGVANPVVASLEVGGATLTSFFAIVLPAMMLAFTILVIVGAVWVLRRHRRRTPAAPSDSPRL